jgi:murein DD-endopeptidase MepM/ murein hydrolase activator NlpD
MVDDAASNRSGHVPAARTLSEAAAPARSVSAIPPVTSPVASLFRRHRLAFLAAMALFSFGGAVAAFAVAQDTPLPTSRRVVEELRAPDINAQLEALANRDDVFVTEQRIRSGDTLGSLFARLGVADAGAERFLRTSESARAFRQLKPGRLMQAHVDEDGELEWLRYAHSATDGKDVAALGTGHALIVERNGEGFVAHDETLANERRVELRSGEIRSSLFAATDAAGLPDGIATQIAEIFSGDIDFYRDLRRGDRFRVVYESYYQGGEFVRAGRILAIEFVNAGKSHSALWYGGNAAGDASTADLAGHYYGFDGRSLRRAFLRTPLEFTRISSGFGGRMHPISNVWRQHTGIDYAAPMGTPVRTTADGVVDFAGVKNGYGNCVIIKHQGVYSTLYGHLSAFAAGLKRGQRVEQGRLIGYVGMTGWATGPHLHYEFRVGDHATNPLTAALPEAPPIARAELGAFRAVAMRFDRQIDLLRVSEGARVAMAGADGNGNQRLVTDTAPGN